MADTKISALTDLAAEPASNDKLVVADTSATETKRVDWSVIKALFTTHALATAANDFLVASGAGAFVKKTLAETLTILGKAAASGLASLDGSSLVVQNPANATATPAASKIVIADGSGKVDGWVSAMSDTVAGKVEAATVAETNTGTDATRAVTPDGLAGSNYGKRIICIPIFLYDVSVATGDCKVIVPIPAELNGWNIVGAQANVYDKGVTGTTNVNIKRRRAGSNVDVLSTAITIGDEWYAADGTINTSNDDLATGDALIGTVSAIHSGTAPKGLSLDIMVQLP